MSDEKKYSFMIQVADLAKGGRTEGRTYKVETTEEERALIQARLGLISLAEFSAKVIATDKGRRSGVLLEGRIKASLEQPCVVSLQPVANVVEAPLYLRLVGPEELERLDEEEAFLDPDADEYDALEGDEIDLGEILVQTLSMALDEFPRAEGAEINNPKNQGVTINEGPLEKKNPFAALEKMRNKT